MLQDDKLALKQQFLEYFAEVPIQKYAGAHIGKDEDTIIRWKQEDTDFADQIAQKKAEYLRQHLKEVKSKEWILERLFKDHFHIEKEGTKNAGPQVTYSPPSWFSNPDEEQLEGEEPVTAQK